MNGKILPFLSGIMLFCACSSLDQRGKDPNDSIARGSARIITDDHTPATMLPVWAKALGLREPKNMQLVKHLSHLTSAVEPRDGFNSVTLVYTGTYENAMSQASRIAKAARLPKSKEYKALRRQARLAGHTYKAKGIAYMNYDLSTRDTNFLIYVRVDEKGKLTLSATDMKQMNYQLKRHDFERKERVKPVK